MSWFGVVLHCVCNMMQQAKSGVGRKWFVYMLACADGTIYTGCTTDVTRRVAEHNTSPRGARYTRSRRPVSLLASFECSDRSEAQREEARVKRLTRRDKMALACDLNPGAGHADD